MESQNTLTVLHGGRKVARRSGLFSCCCVKLYDIITYFNKFKQLPLYIDCSEQLQLYKTNSNDDITYSYFSHPDNIEMNISYTKPIDFHYHYQFSAYTKLDFDNIIPIFKKYFTVSDEVNGYINDITEKYKLHYDNICVLFYRGNDKITETKLKSYDDVIAHAKQVKKENPDIQFLFQSDEIEFVEECLKNFPDGIVFYDEVRMINKSKTSVDKCLPNNFYYSKLFLAIVVIMSKCKFVITGSLGNIPLFICLYRENVEKFIS